MLLLIPGPVTTDARVRAAAAQDYAPWDNDFRELYRQVCAGVLRAACARPDEHVALALPGCGHFAVEAAIRTLMPPGGRLLVPSTGAYASRLQRLAVEAGRVAVPLYVGVRDRIDPQAVAQALEQDPTISHVALVYSETSSGICHDAPAIARVAQALGRRVIIDAVSAFGALPLDLSDLPAVDAVALTANKCLEGLPGAAFVVARRDSLDAAQGRAGSWSLDLADIYQQSLQPNAGPRFTPPAPTLAAFAVALARYHEEGREARLARYTANMRALYQGVGEIGLTPWLPPALQGPIVVNAGPGHAGLGPAGLRRRAQAPRLRAQQFQEHRTAFLPCRLHRRLLGRPDAASRPGHGRGAVRTRHPRDRRRPEAGAPFHPDRIGNTNMRLLHTMLRVGNLDKSIDFYTNVLGMRVLRRNDYPDGKFTLAFVGYQDEAEGAVIELTHNWDTDKYDLGSGYGHIALEVDNAYEACDKVKERGGKVTREAGPMKHGTTVIAFVEDPDGYKIEFIQKKG